MKSKFMVNISTNRSKTNNHISSKITENKKANKK